VKHFDWKKNRRRDLCTGMCGKLFLSKYMWPITFFKLSSCLWNFKFTKSYLQISISPQHPKIIHKICIANTSRKTRSKILINMKNYFPHEKLWQDCSKTRKLMIRKVTLQNNNLYRLCLIWYLFWELIEIMINFKSLIEHSCLQRR
jgi:hypothetical protein